MLEIEHGCFFEHGFARIGRMGLRNLLGVRVICV